MLVFESGCLWRYILVIKMAVSLPEDEDDLGIKTNYWIKKQLEQLQIVSNRIKVIGQNYSCCSPNAKFARIVFILSKYQKNDSRKLFIKKFHWTAYLMLCHLVYLIFPLISVTWFLPEVTATTLI